MKKSLAILLVLILVLGAASIWYNNLSFDYSATEVKTDSVISAPVETDEISKTVSAPDFTVLDTEGNSIKLSDLFGKPIVINFWATWCGPCRSEFPAYEDAYLEYGEDIVFLMVNLTDGQRDTVESVAAFVQENSYSFPVYFDTSMEAAISYGAFSIPLSVFIDSDGNIIAVHRGAMSKDTLYAYIDDIIE